MSLTVDKIVHPKTKVDQRLYEAIFDSILGDTTRIPDEKLQSTLTHNPTISCKGCGSTFTRDLIYDNPVEEILGFMGNPENFYYTCRWLFNVELVPFQVLILQELWNRKFPMLLMTRGGGKTFLLGLYSILRAMFDPGCKVVLIGAAFRQSKLLFEYMEQIWRIAPVFRNMVGTGKGEGPKRDIDRCNFYIGDSDVIALPLGDGSRIRGLRSNYTICDEFASIPQDIYEIVIKGFSSVTKSPDSQVASQARIQILRSLGLSYEADTEEEALGFGNQSIVSGTAFYTFNHFYQYWKRYKAIVESHGDKNRLEDIFMGSIPQGFDWQHYSVIRVPYTLLPKGFMDDTQIAQAKATFHSTNYLMEYGACFVGDSNGFFKRSLIESCVCRTPISLPSGSVQFQATTNGSPNKRYVIGVDPASENDNFSITVLELHEDHRRIVYAWSITREELRSRLSRRGAVGQKSFYSYCARKIRDLIKVFPTSHVGMDSQGGGIAIMEALHDPNELEPGELPIWPYIRQGENDVYWWEEKDKPTDGEPGLHILHMVQFANAQFMADSNHGLRKDFESKVTLFPFFDTATLGLALENDKLAGREFDTLEDCVMEIEAMKDELTTIIHEQTLTGRDRWDTPQIKKAGGKIGRLRKDRYTSLLIANMLARVTNTYLQGFTYKPIGGFVGNASSKSRAIPGRLYTGPEHIVSKMTGTYGVGVFRR